MKTIKITSQEEFDKLPKSFTEYTEIHLYIPVSKTVEVKFNRINSTVKVYDNSTVYAYSNSAVKVYDNSTVRAYDKSTVIALENSTVYAYVNSTVEAWENSTVTAYDKSTVRALNKSTVYAYSNSTVKAWDNSTVIANDNSTVIANDNSTVIANDNSTVTAYDKSTVNAYVNSKVTAYDNSTVYAWNNSTVNAYVNSTVTAYDKSTVNAYYNSTVNAYDNSTVKSFSSDSKILGFDNSVVILQDCKPSIKISGKVTIVNTTKMKHTIESFVKRYGYGTNSKEIILYKSVNPRNNKDFYTNSIGYTIGEEIICPDFDPNINRKCGGGFHLSPTSEMALSYNKGKVLKCSVHIDDIVVYPNDITKVRCRKVKVLEEYKG